jgi:DtxR family Mn-dependent transcriptional regulator
VVGEATHASGTVCHNRRVDRRRGHHSVDDYLEVIYSLVFPVGEYRPSDAATPIAARVADRMGLSRAAVGEMLKRLMGQGLIERGAKREIVLTPAGIERAEHVVRRRRIVERFLTDFLGYDPAEVHAHADQLGDTFTEEMIERMHERLGFPERCPHGWPVLPATEHGESEALRPLVDLEVGDRGEIICIAEHDAELLAWFYAEGLTPGVSLEVLDVQPAAGHLKVRVGDDEHVIAEKAAGSLFLRSRSGAKKRPAVNSS